MVAVRRQEVQPSSRMALTRTSLEINEIAADRVQINLKKHVSYVNSHL